MEPENPTNKKHESAIGPFAGIIIILLVFIIGGFYFSKQTIEEKKQEAAERAAVENEPEFVDETSTTTVKEIHSTSTPEIKK
jgi:hypothetical protein